MTIYLSNALRQLKINLLGYHSNRSLTMFNATAKKTTSNETIINFSYLAFRSYWLIRSREVIIRCSLRMYLSIVLLIVPEESTKDKDHRVLGRSLVTGLLSYWGRPMFENRVFPHLSRSVGLGRLGRYCDLLLALSEERDEMMLLIGTEESHHRVSLGTWADKKNVQGIWLDYGDIKVDYW